MKRKLLWVGDAVVSSGFARATHKTLEGLTPDYDVTVLGINHRGDPHDHPYPIYAPYAHDLLGFTRVPELCARLQPDVIVLQNDVWQIDVYMKFLKHHKITIPVVGSVAIDGKNCQGAKLNGLALAIFWTEFAEREAMKGGYTGPSAVIPLGVDLDTYFVRDVANLRLNTYVGRGLLTVMPDVPLDFEKFRNGFVVGNVNRNQYRKRLDLMVEYFCEWVHEKRVDDAFLMLQLCPTGEKAFDVTQLMEYYGLADRLAFIEPEILYGVPEENLAWIYRCLDVYMTTTQGEGMGLTALEASACGVPVVAPDWSALGELYAGHAQLVPCTSHAVTPEFANVIGGIMDKRGAIEALDLLYRDRERRLSLSEAGLDLVRQDRFRWKNIGAAFNRVLTDALFPTTAESAVPEEARRDLEPSMFR